MFYQIENIYTAIKKQIKAHKYPKSNLYGNGKAGVKIANKLSKIKLTIKKELSYL